MKLITKRNRLVVRAFHDSIKLLRILGDIEEMKKEKEQIKNQNFHHFIRRKIYNNILR